MRRIKYFPFIIAVFLSFSLIFMSCNREKKKTKTTVADIHNPASPDGVSQKENMPVITFEKSMLSQLPFNGDIRLFLWRDGDRPLADFLSAQAAPHHDFGRLLVPILQGEPSFIAANLAVAKVIRNQAQTHALRADAAQDVKGRQFSKLAD